MDVAPGADTPARAEVRLGPRVRHANDDYWRTVLDAVMILSLALTLAYLTQRFIVKPYRIPSPSMRTTLDEGDRILALRFPLDYSNPDRKEVVVFHPPGRGQDALRGATTKADVTYVKRVIGLPGETIQGVHNHITICQRPKQDCHELKEPYARGRTYDFGPITIPAHAYFLMGDNRENSEDSRVWGTLPRDNMVGEAIVTYWPLTRLGAL